jgi:hypothetical protein
MTRVDTRQRRPRGLIDKLPSGRLRVRVYTGYDPVTKRPLHQRDCASREERTGDPEGKKPREGSDSPGEPGRRAS